MNNSRIKPCLFVGGCKDGTWLNVDVSHEYITFPVLHRPNINFDNSNLEETTVIKNNVYRRLFFTCDGRDFYVYGDKNLPNFSVWNMIFSYYGEKHIRDEMQLLQ